MHDRRCGAVAGLAAGALRCSPRVAAGLARRWALGPAARRRPAPPRQPATRRRSACCSTSRYLFPFELTSFMLLVAMVGAVVIARGRREARRRRRRCPAPERPHDPALLAARRSARCCSRIGVVGVLVRRNALVIFMSHRADAERREPGVRRVRARSSDSLDGQVFVFFVMAVAAAEAAVGPRDHRQRLPQRARRWTWTRSTCSRADGRDAVPDSLWLDPGAAARRRSLLNLAARRPAARKRGVGAARPAARSALAFARRGRAARALAGLAAPRTRAHRRDGRAPGCASATSRSTSRSARPALGGDDPGRHRRRLPDPRLLDRLHGARPAASGASSPT